MNRNKKKMIYFIGVLCFLGMAIFYASKVNSFSDITSVKYQGGVLSKSDVDRLNNQISGTKQSVSRRFYSFQKITGWYALRQVVVCEVDSGRESRVNAYHVYGDMENVYPARLEKGSFVTSGDKWGCVISLKTAEYLFQSSNVLGCIVKYNQKLYTIRGILHTQEEAILVSEEDENKLFTNLEIHSAALVKDFLMQNELLDYISFLDGNFYGFLARIVIAFLFLFMQLLIFRKCQEILRKEKRRLFFLWKAACLVCFTVGCTFLIVQSVLPIPVDFLPDRLSDFDFWTKLFMQWKKEYQMICEQIWYREVHLIKNLHRCLISSAALVIWLMAGLLLKSRKKNNYLKS